MTRNTQQLLTELLDLVDLDEKTARARMDKILEPAGYTRALTDEWATVTGTGERPWVASDEPDARAIAAHQGWRVVRRRTTNWDPA